MDKPRNEIRNKIDGFVIPLLNQQICNCGLELVEFLNPEQSGWKRLFDSR